jgi:hypothetical protein
MSLPIDNLEDLKNLLRASQTKLNGVEDLKELLATVNANYNADAARVRVAKQMALVVPVVAFVFAGLLTCVALFTVTEHMRENAMLAALAILWGVPGVVAIVTTVASSICLFAARRGSYSGTPQAAPPARNGSSALFGDRSPHVTLPDEL